MKPGLDGATHRDRRGRYVVDGEFDDRCEISDFPKRKTWRTCVDDSEVTDSRIHHSIIYRANWSQCIFGMGKEGGRSIWFSSMFGDT